MCKELCVKIKKKDVLDKWREMEMDDHKRTFLDLVYSKLLDNNELNINFEYILELIGSISSSDNIINHEEIVNVLRKNPLTQNIIEDYNVEDNNEYYTVNTKNGIKVDIENDILKIKVV